MKKSFIVSKLNDKYYKKYNNLFNYLLNKFFIINNNILFNFHIINNSYANILFKSMYYVNDINKLNINYENYIIDKINNNINISNKKVLYIQNYGAILKNNYIFKKKNIGDVLFFYNNNFKNDFINKYILPELNKFTNNLLIKKIYSSPIYEIYKQFLINLKNSNEEHNILIPNYKYYFISINIAFIDKISLTASYKMTLIIPNIISTLAMSLKLIEKNGTLLLFWTIVNVNIPIIKKILSLLSYGFKTVEIIDNDINQNLLIGVTNYYIKCSGYKDNISNDLINKLLDIAIETINYNYDDNQYIRLL